ncbi:unknown [Clostridium sp. CAG:628]|nr:unknown [Clostridium sp. CAG:628]
MSVVNTELKLVLAPGLVDLSAKIFSYNVGKLDLNVILQVLLLVILLIVYVLPESVPPHVFVSNSALKPEFGVTVNNALPPLPTA